MASRSYSSLSSGLGALTYRLFVTLVELMIVRGKPRRVLEAELIALLHQVAVLQRTSTRPELADVDRGLMAGLARVLPRPVRHRFIVTPDHAAGLAPPPRRRPMGPPATTARPAPHCG